MRAKLLAALVVGGFVSANSSTSALAATYNCPAPAQINCVPAANKVLGWTANGGQMTGNSFAPNNQCGNVDKLSPNTQRLLCCYVKCGVFYLDVKAKSCTKVSESEFNCE
jgi:hypothetical protein